MRVVVEVVHPADVLFFKRPIETLHARGDAVLVLSRKKDVACDLLDEFGIPHTPLTTAGSGTVGLARELVQRDFATLGAVRRFKPDVMAGFGGVAISHVGKLTRVPSVSFYDSENAALQTRITWPFISHLYVPRSYRGPTPVGRTTRLPGVKELSFFHPNGFRPNRETALRVGLDPDRPNYFVRIVEWRANHDLGKAGWTPDVLRAVIARLEASGVVHLSSELPLSDDLAQYAYKGPKNAVHHLIAACRAFVGESATMASEAAVLGVPALYAGRDFPGYTRELAETGLQWNVENASAGSLCAAIDEMLAVPQSDIVATRDRYLESCPDWSEAIIEALERHAKRPARSAT
ncbi:hypothetical protein [Jannaschia aquimarina]|uniref:DUF354 domain-containing protein n=1 Tax=Jannaschia aquimarina TaxID=935700 RepID=A0A0D1EK44_9RHOB|nr:hypothetical protein [Jannaschia aquimarina]KIT17939.1 hypothetical protein jaqu_02960 [Jannaschia aquimarina]SNT08508.1 hypothetical protein SAMN05421775_105177 [Jannaschia aquimarina]